MPIANPMVQGGGGYAAPPPAAGAPNDAGPAVESPPTRTSLTGLTGGMGGWSDPNNVSAHCGLLVAAALGVVILLKVSGFRFAVDSSVG